MQDLTKVPVIMNRLELSIRGMSPRPWESGERKWCEYMVDGCLKTKRKYKKALSKALWFNVTLVFYLGPGRFKNSNLDNLVKPVLDTLFYVPKPQSKIKVLTGAIVNRNDGEILKLTLEKRLERDLAGQGIDVIIEWSQLPDYKD